ncbi:DNA polymerase III subunit gamma/tau [Mycoplasmopsis lipofaciens]|uniref:DNA polymerase III subunit gamma/tau n=1 Tax=Mycoplasmopsis lipofaciens TaxID=114884 RepID=UPI0004839B55|nr:DNA polymerase III subunit gamma/tau [Mycoplasmopsis lipofaciens]
MSYKALYRKYRPKTFDDVKGQNHIIITLKNAILNHKISHAYLFSGPRGVGKTSVAKIFAAILNCGHCENLSELCDNCLNNIDNNFDIIEMDAASNNGVNEIRELKDKIQHTPSKGNYKVYIIDEVHMLSKGAFNALLKTLEEPPQHAIFILATTDPQKIPLTILSRVQRYNFRKMTNDVLIEQIKFVLDKEKIKYEEETIKYIARLATGGMRDALSIVDQASAYGAGEIRFEDVVYAFGITSNDSLIQITNNLYKNNIKECLKIFNDLKNGGIDSNQFIEGFINLLKDYLIYNSTYDEKLLEWTTLDELQNLQIDIPFAFKVSELLYKLIKESIYSENVFQLIELYLIKINEINKNNKNNFINKQERKMDTEKTTKIQKDSIENVLEKTQEMVLEANKNNDDIQTINDELLSNTYENNEFTSEVDDGLIKTAEISLDEETQQINQITSKLDFQNYQDRTSFKNKLNEKDIQNLLFQSEDMDFYKLCKEKLKTAIKVTINQNYKGLIKALSKLKLLAAGKNFLFFVSDDIPALNFINDNCYNQVIQNFFVDYLDGYKHLFVYDDIEEYKRIAQKTQIAIINNEIPEITKLGPIIIEKSETPTSELLLKLENAND